jgi:hypothetical protein
VHLAANAKPAAAAGGVSPSGCNILYVSNPHVSDYFNKKGVKAVKVNVKSQCKSPVPELTLSVTLLDNGKPIAKTVEKVSNKAYILNESTYVLCKNTEDVHVFQGTALGTSYEDGKLFDQIKVGNSISLPCGY